MVGDLGISTAGIIYAAGGEVSPGGLHGTALMVSLVVGAMGAALLLPAHEFWTSEVLKGLDLTMLVLLCAGIPPLIRAQRWCRPRNRPPRAGRSREEQQPPAVGRPPDEVRGAQTGRADHHNGAEQEHAPVDERGGDRRSGHVERDHHRAVERQACDQRAAL